MSRRERRELDRREAKGVAPIIEVVPLKLADRPSHRVQLIRAACRSGDLCFIGWRHSDISQYGMAPRGLYMDQDCQGFYCSEGYWWDRRMSGIIAARVRQGGLMEVPELLVSEMLWDNQGRPL